jgi:hypothetical protein
MAKYINRGTLKVWFVPTLASQSAPSIAAIEAGTDLTGRIAAISGFTFSATKVDTPTLDTLFDLSIAGTYAAEDSELTVYDINDASDAVKTALATVNTNGFIVFAPYGLTTTKKCEVWPVNVGSYSTTKTVENEAAKSMISVFITAAPNLAATLAA